MLILDAVNRVLVSAQLQPVTTLASPDRLVSKANTIIEDVRRRELEKGWNFNEEYDLPVAAVATIIAVPASTLAVDIRPENCGGKDIVVRNGQMYNRTDLTNDFGTQTLKLDVIYDITFDNCPLVFQEYVVACASVKFAVQVSVDPDTARQLRSDEARAWQRLRQSDTQQSSLSVLNRYPIVQIARRWPQIT